MIGKYHPAVILYLHSPGVGVRASAVAVCMCEKNDVCVYQLMCKMLLFVSAAVLEVMASGNPAVMREGISSSPHSSPLVLSFVFVWGNGICSLLILIAHRICGRRGAGTWARVET